jgi:glycosyltransferase involved in cell wall biosynthesis
LHSGGFFTQYQKSYWAKRFLFSRILRLFKVFIVDSEVLAQQLSALGIHKDRIIIVSPFLPMGKTPGLPLPLHLDLFLNDRPHTILLTGWAYSRLYNFEIGIRILNKLRNQGVNAGLIILNSGMEVDKGYREELQLEIRKHGLMEHILFVTNLPTLDTLYRRAAVLLRLTTHDGNSLSVKEALACSLPVVASDVIARPEGTFTVSLNDFDQMYDTVLSIIQSNSKVEMINETIHEEMNRNLSNIINCYDRYFSLAS